MRSLSTVDCSSVSEASDLFATETGLLIIRPHQKCKSCICGSIWFTIPSGCYALVSRHGEQLDYVDENGKTPIWPAGLHFPYGPNVEVSCLVTKRDTLLEMSVNGCKTQDDVMLDIDVTVTFRIMGDIQRGEDPYLVRKFVDEVRPSELEYKLRFAQEEVVRARLAQIKAHDVYSWWNGETDDRLGVGNRTAEEGKRDEETDYYRYPNQDVTKELLKSFDDDSPKHTKKSRITDDMRMRLNDEFTQMGVKIQSVAIKYIHLPSDIRSKMEEKAMSTYHDNTLREERDGQKLKLKEDVKTMRQSFLTKATCRTQAGLEEMSGERVKLDDAIVKASRTEANIREGIRGEINNKIAQQNAEMDRVKNSKAATVEKIRVEIEKDTAELLANAKLHYESTLGKAYVKASQISAKATLILSMAEGKIAPWMEKRHQFDTRMQEMNVGEIVIDRKDFASDALNPMSPTAVDAFVSEISTSDNTRKSLLSELGMTGKSAVDVLNC